MPKPTRAVTADTYWRLLLKHWRRGHMEVWTMLRRQPPHFLGMSGYEIK